MESRFAYNPKTKHFLECDTCHSTALYNAKKQKEFDLYIRGILKDGILYLRTFYPLKDIDTKTLEDIKETSFNLLYDNKEVIKLKIKEVYQTKIKKIVYNAENDLLTGILANV